LFNSVYILSDLVTDLLNCFILRCTITPFPCPMFCPSFLRF